MKEYTIKIVNKSKDKSITANGNDHTIKHVANFKHVTGSFFEIRMPNSDAPAICIYMNIQVSSRFT